MKEVKGAYQGKGKKLAVIVSRFNEMISSRLLTGCIDELKKMGTEEKNISVFWAPGSFEIPQVLSRLCDKKGYDAFIVLGAIIRGDTPHFDYIAAELSKGITSLSLSKKIPVAFGVITADTLEQAIERAGTKQGNRGRDVARTAVEMADLFTRI